MMSPGNFAWNASAPIAVNSQPVSQPNFISGPLVTVTLDPQTENVFFTQTGGAPTNVFQGETDPESGSALITGSLYFNVTDGSIWQVQVAAGINIWALVGFFQSVITSTLPVVVATVDLKNQTAAISNQLLYAVPQNQPGLYRVSYAAKVTTPASVSSSLGGTTGLYITYTDMDDLTVLSTPVAMTNGQNSTSSQINGSIILNASRQHYFELFLWLHIIRDIDGL